MKKTRAALSSTGRRPKLHKARMVLGFSGWMDGGDASTGPVEYLVTKLAAQEFATIEPGQFYIYNFPGTMEVSSLFRPDTAIEDGLVRAYREPTNTFYCDEETGLVLFKGKEPNLQWREYAECVLSPAEELGVDLICFVGSVAGIVPHTREPRFHGTVSDESLKTLLDEHEVAPSNYEGPASITTYLMTLAREKGLKMISLVTEVPAYVQGRNVKCIEAVAKKLRDVLGLSIDLGDLTAMSERFEQRLNDVVRDRPELAELLRKVEADYDRETTDTRMADLKAWFEKQDIRLD